MKPAPVAPPRPRIPSERKVWILSAAAHLAVVLFFVAYALLKPRPPAVAVFELVSGEPQTLRAPARPAPAPPAEAPPPEPEPAPPEPDAPALVTKPKEAKAPPKPEPKKAAPPRDSVPKAARPSEAPAAAAPEGGMQITNASSGMSGLSRWGQRVSQQILPLWNPPGGIDVELPDTIAVRFKVAVEDGTISDVAIAKSSGNRLLDEETLRAVKRRERVVPPKNMVSGGFSEDFLQVRYEFIYKGY